LELEFKIKAHLPFTLGPVDVRETLGISITADLFPDEAFSFPINNQFVKNFCGSFITPGKLFDPENFTTASGTSIFLNQMITTIADFQRSTGMTSFVPLRYFTDAHSRTPMLGGPRKVKPDIIVTPLIDGYVQKGSIDWKDVKSIIELTQEKRPPTRMARMVSLKSYMTFCYQPNRDFIPFFCITHKAIHIVVTDHVSHIETNVIPFDCTATTLIFFLRMVMGLAFLPDSYLGLNTTITRLDNGVRGDGKLSDVYRPFSYNTHNPRIQLFLPDPSNPPTTTLNVNNVTADNPIVSISVNNTIYQVIWFIF
jgi:Fungal protein kinase